MNEAVRLNHHAHIMYCSVSDKVGRVRPIWPQSAAPVNVAKYILSTAYVRVPGRHHAPTPRPEDDAQQSTKQVIPDVCTCNLC